MRRDSRFRLHFAFVLGDTHTVMKQTKRAVSVASLFLVLFASQAIAQSAGGRSASAEGDKAPPKPQVILPDEAPPVGVASETEMNCGGYIRYAPSPNFLQIVGGEEEQEQYNYA